MRYRLERQWSRLRRRLNPARRRSPKLHVIKVGSDARRTRLPKIEMTDRTVVLLVLGGLLTAGGLVALYALAGPVLPPGGNPKIGAAPETTPLSPGSAGKAGRQVGPVGVVSPARGQSGGVVAAQPAVQPIAQPTTQIPAPRPTSVTAASPRTGGAPVTTRSTSTRSVTVTQPVTETKTETATIQAPVPASVPEPSQVCRTLGQSGKLRCR